MALLAMALTTVTWPAFSAERNGVEVKRQRASQIRRFNPGNPPDEMPPLRPSEAAVTVSEFSCSAQMQVIIVEENQQGGQRHARARVESIHVTIGLNVTIWLPTNAPQKIRDHEIAHRAISDHYFDLGERTARALAEPCVGRIIEGDADDVNTAVDQAIKAAIREITGRYMSQIESRAGEAQKTFDDLTDHGRNNVRESEAIAQAIEQAG